MTAWNNTANVAEIEKFITETTSNSNAEDYGWLGQSPNMVEWVDERRLKALNDFDYRIKNKSYEATLAVDRDEVEDDQLGAIKIRIADMVTKAKTTFPRTKFFELLNNGEVDLAYDGQPFFSASHSEGTSGTQSNLVTGTGTTLAQVGTDLDTARARIRGFKDDIGDLMNEGELEFHVICPLGLEAVFNKLNNADVIGTETNIYKGQIKSILATGRLTGNSWYLMDASSGVKAIIRQVRRAVEFNSLQEESEMGFMRKKYAYGVDTRVGYGYGLWQKAVKVKNS